MESKICTKCNSEKLISEFHKNKRIKDGHHYICKSCCKQFSSQHYKKNKDLFKKYYENNLSTIKERKKKHYNINKDKIKNKNKEYYENNKPDILKQKKTYSKTNKDKLKKYNTIYSKEYRRKKISTDKFFKFKCSVRDLIKRSIRDKNFTKKSKSGNILGCSYEEFRQYIESKFEPWMNWNNYGNWNGVATSEKQSWDLDHIIPLSSAKTEEDIIKLNNYKNFQPLCSYFNRFIKKGN